MLFPRLDEIGGAVVRRTFTFDTRRLKTGDRLTRDEVIGMPGANRAALIEKQYIDVLPRASDQEVDVADPDVERHVVNRGFGKWDVIEGRKLNAEPLDKDEAEALAAVKN
jgi:hypothetical protein